MPVLGEKVRGNTIGRLPDGYYVWVKCPDCDYERWVSPKGPNSKPLNTIRRCTECSRSEQKYNFTLPGSRPHRNEKNV
jgi:ribosomal protein S27E